MVGASLDERLATLVLHGCVYVALTDSDGTALIRSAARVIYKPGRAGALIRTNQNSYTSWFMSKTACLSVDTPYTEIEWEFDLVSEITTSQVRQFLTHINR